MDPDNFDTALARGRAMGPDQVREFIVARK
jgi:hypothetical protein